MLQTSINDDFIFTDVAQDVEYLDLTKSKSARTKVSGLENSDETCKVTRPRESELFNADRDLNDVKLAIRCKDSFRIQTANGEAQLRVAKDLNASTHGDLRRGFVAADSAEQMLLFDDLSLHYYQRNSRLWQREEALSQITQVEILDQSLIQKKNSAEVESEIAQMKQMHEPVSLAEIPGRII